MSLSSKAADPHVAESIGRRPSEWVQAQRPQVPPRMGPPGHRRGGAVTAQHAPTAPDPSVRAGTEDRGHVGHGRTSTARVTGSRAIISPRLVLAPGRGGHRARTWTRAATTAIASRPPEAPEPPTPATRPVYRLLLMKGLSPTEAASLTAFICGLPTSDLNWSLKQVNQLLFLRRMRQLGPIRRPRRSGAPTGLTCLPNDGEATLLHAVDPPKRRRASSRRRGLSGGIVSRGAPGSHLLAAH